MHEIRQSLRGEGIVLMGKNTMVRRGCAEIGASQRRALLSARARKLIEVILLHIGPPSVEDLHV